MLEYGFAGFLDVGEQSLLNVLGKGYTVGIVDGGLDDLVIAGLAEMLETGCGDIGLFKFFCKIGGELVGELVWHDGEDDLCALQKRIIFIDSLYKERHQGGNPAVAVDDVGIPAQLPDGLDDTFGIEDRPRVVVGVERPFGIVVLGFPFEEVLAVDEVNLHADILKGGDLDDQRVVSVLNDDVLTGKPDDLVQHVLVVVHAAEFRHERANFVLSLLYSLG